jgi:hypothetical protein
LITEQYREPSKFSMPLSSTFYLNLETLREFEIPFLRRLETLDDFFVFCGGVCRKIDVARRCDHDRFEAFLT